MSYEIPKWAVDGATVMAFIFAALPYLISPEATNKALPRFVKRFRGWIAAVAFLVFMWLMHKQPFMHARLPVWGAVDGVMGLAVVTLTFLRLSATRQGLEDREKPLTEIVVQEITFPIRDGIILDDPICTKCDWETSQVHPPDLPSGMVQWRCRNPHCRQNYIWRNEGYGNYKEVASAAARAILRKRGSQQRVDTHYRL
jgi:hypothetical protein